MKPSHLAQSALLPRLFGLISVVLIGCAGSVPQVTGDDDDQPPPPMIKEPPAPKDNSTAAGCDGVTASGECQEGVAVTCDVEAGELRRKDCKALGKTCVMDTQTGAKCETAGSGGGGTGGECGNGITNEGSCGGDLNQTATWCDALSGQTIVWDCDAEQKQCRTDCMTASGTAIPGAFCCGAGGAPPAASNECPALGFEGECNPGNTMARWCMGDELIEQTCTDGKVCVFEPNGVGAICKAPQVQGSECEQLGFEGRCVGGKPRWCDNGEVMEVTCNVGTQCEENGPDCNVGGGDAGAYCCSP